MCCSDALHLFLPLPLHASQCGSGRTPTLILMDRGPVGSTRLDPRLRVPVGETSSSMTMTPLRPWTWTHTPDAPVPSPNTPTATSRPGHPMSPMTRPEVFRFGQVAQRRTYAGVAPPGGCRRLESLGVNGGRHRARARIARISLRSLAAAPGPSPNGSELDRGGRPVLYYTCSPQSFVTYRYSQPHPGFFCRETSPVKGSGRWVRSLLVYSKEYQYLTAISHAVQ
jgi:hypothetical protein